MAGVNIFAYAIGSVAAVIGVIINAFHTHEQFYPAVMYLSRSKPCLMIIGNLGLVTTILLGHGMKRAFLGKLREIEVEHLTDRIWATITDTLLAMTIFRNEFNSTFVVFFTVLLFLKIFHWLTQDRVDYIQHSPVSNLTSFRMFSLMIVLLVADFLLLTYAGTHAWYYGPSMMVLFGFEFLLLLIALVSTMVKFFVNLVDSRRETQWEGKGAFMLYLEFLTDIAQFGVYLVFFGIVMRYYGMPLHLVRNVYLTFRSIKMSIATLYRYKQATANMNERFPEIDFEELMRADDNNVDNICVVCREEMQRGKRLPCGHVLHATCLLNWLQRQQTCPTCRTSVFAPQPQPLVHNNNNVNHPQPRVQQQQMNNGDNDVNRNAPDNNNDNVNDYRHTNDRRTNDGGANATDDQRRSPLAASSSSQQQQQRSPSSVDSDGYPGASAYRDRLYRSAASPARSPATSPSHNDLPHRAEEAAMAYDERPMAVEHEMLQMLQVLQIQVSALSEQVSQMRHQLDRLAPSPSDHVDAVPSAKGKERVASMHQQAGEQEERSRDDGDDDDVPDTPEKLRRKRLLRFSQPTQQ